MTVRQDTYKEGLHKKLRDPKTASAYLNKAHKNGDIQEFLLAIRDVAEANDRGKTVSSSKENI